MEGLSAKLKTFEDVSNNYMINMEPRQHYMGARQGHPQNMPMNAPRTLGMLKNNQLRKNPNLKKNMNGKSQLVTNQHLNRMAQNFMQKSQGSISNLKSGSNNGNRFRLSRGGKSTNRGMNNIFDGNKLAGSSTFNGLGNTSKLGNSGNFFDNFNPQNFNKRSLQFNRGNGFQGGYNTAPNMGGYMSPLAQSAEFGQFDGLNMGSFGGQDPNDIDMEGDEIEFKYNHDFDENGALYWLGTYGKTANYSNPYTLGQVKVFFSSMGRGSYEDFVGRALVNCRTLNEPNAFMGIDFGPGKFLVPSCYTIKNRDSTRHVLLNWIFEVN